MKIFLPKFEQKTPTIIQDFQEVTIILYSPHFQPHLITEKILKEKQIIPQDWILVSDKLVNLNVMLFTFKNGFKIQTEIGKIYFSMRINKSSVLINEIITKFIYSFPQFIYTQVQILPRRLISLPGDLFVAQQFIVKTFLLKGQWQNFKNVQPKVQLQFFYKFNTLSLVLKITEVKFKNNSKKVKPALFFRGVFSEKLNYNNKITSIKKLDTIINNYQEYLMMFNQIIDNMFCD